MATNKKQDEGTAVKAAGENQAKEQENKPKAAPVRKSPTVVKRSARHEVQQPDPEEKIETAINRTEEYIHKNWKTLLTILVVAVILVTGILGYKYLHQAKKPEKAGAAMFTAEQLFAEDSFELALNGDGNNAGFLEIIERYGSSAQGNIAKHYAGLCYLKLEDYDNALMWLSRYKPTKGAPNQILNAQNKGLQGDIYVQRGDYARATELYNEAVKASDNSFTAPMYLKKLGLVYSTTGRHSDAREAYRKIADEYPGSMEARDIQKYLGAEEQK